MLKIKDYETEAYGRDSDTQLINNAEIIDIITNEALTIEEIKKLKLFINTLSCEVFRYFDDTDSFEVDDRYQYDSY